MKWLWSCHLTRARARIDFLGGADTSANGSGLGLAIVETAVKRLGGQVDFASREGGGELVRMQFALGQVRWLDPACHERPGRCLVPATLFACAVMRLAGQGVFQSRAACLRRG
ncbi:ATP-binding protein [Roseovarius sp. Pro17]|uniref:ATP-binding protein n=1 Tax=Roseovarius sp. Pro17 TaxID=3108175 RepID=UPI002D79C956|nr:ATP-binding protein [Roseovarius sp. Pro17]